MRRRGLAALTLSGALALTACAAAVDRTWTPEGWQDTVVRLADAPEALDPASVAALVPQRLRNDVVGIQARFALLPGAAPVNERVLAIVRGAIDDRAATSGAHYAPQVFARGAGMGDRLCARGSTTRGAEELLADPALGPAGGTGAAVVCDIVAASGTVVGQRVRVVNGDGGAVTSDTTTILYGDVATGEVADATGLWRDDAVDPLWTSIVDTLRREAGALSLRPVQPPDDVARAAFAAALTTTVPVPDGSLALTIPAGFTAPELAELGVAPTGEPMTLAVPAALAASLTTPIGATLVAAAGSPYQAPAAVPAGHEPVDCGLLPCVALTYDDGPSEFTPVILDALARHHAAATFFAMGEKAAAYADVLRRTVAEGHEVENHTWNHPRLPRLDAAAVSRQIRDTTSALEAQTGKPVTMFRPPYGEYNAAVLAAAGLPAILWDVDTLDWQGPADDVLIQRAVDPARPGSIVLLHDIHEVTARTAEAVYEGLTDRGFRLVTVGQLFGDRMPTSGAVRSAR